MIDERIEQLITRRLDGELTDDESLDLDRELIRSPEARRAFEDSQRIDILTAETLNVLLDAGRSEHSHPEAGFVSPAARRVTRRRLDGTIGIAAAVLLIMAGTSFFPQFGSNTDHAGFVNPPSNVVPTVPVAYPLVVDNTAGPRRQRQRIDQDVIAVVDPETQTVYLLEIQRTRNSTDRLRADY